MAFQGRSTSYFGRKISIHIPPMWSLLCSITMSLSHPMQPLEFRKPIPTWAAEDRPREKMVSKGTHALTDTELVAMLLGTGTRQHSAIDLARHLIAHFGGLTNLSRASVGEMIQIKGVGQAKATSIIAAFELARRRLANEAQRTHFSDSTSLARYLIPKVGDKSIEVFYVVYLDRQNQVLAEEELFRGGISNVTVDGRLVFKQAMSHSASSIVVCHNHPSGRPTPSRADDLLTEHLLGIAEIVGISVLDHIIVTHRQWYSYADQGLLKPMRTKFDTVWNSHESAVNGGQVA
jgi:DNA repair protein RadC